MKYLEDNGLDGDVATVVQQDPLQNASIACSDIILIDLSDFVPHFLKSCGTDDSKLFFDEFALENALFLAVPSQVMGRMIIVLESYVHQVKNLHGFKKRLVKSMHATSFDNFRYVVASVPGFDVFERVADVMSYQQNLRMRRKLTAKAC